MKFTKREILGVFFVLIIGLFSLESWREFFTVVMTPGTSGSWQPIVWFSFLAVFFFLGTIVWTNLILRLSGAAFIFLPGLFFIREWEYIVLGAVSVIFIYWSARAIAWETKERVRFHFFRNVRAGQFIFVIGLSLVISGGYYVFLKNAVWDDLVPRFKIGEGMTSVTFKVAGVINPSFAKLSQNNTTVDEFLLSLEQSSMEEGNQSQALPEKKGNSQNIANAFPQINQFLNGKNVALFSGMNQEQIAQQLFLKSGREQIATLVGRPVAGDEKIADALSVALQNKLITILNVGEAAQHIPSSAVPFFISLLLFLTLLSIGAVFIPFCILAAELLFAFLLWIKWLKKETFMVEQEKLLE